MSSLTGRVKDWHVPWKHQRTIPPLENIVKRSNIAFSLPRVSLFFRPVNNLLCTHAPKISQNSSRVVLFVFLCGLHEVCSHIMARAERLSRGLVSYTCTHCGPNFVLVYKQLYWLRNLKLIAKHLDHWARLQNTRPRLRDINVLLPQSSSQWIFAYGNKREIHVYSSFFKCETKSQRLREHLLYTHVIFPFYRLWEYRTAGTSWLRDHGSKSLM